MFRKRARMALVLALCMILQLCGAATLAAGEAELAPSDQPELMDSAAKSGNAMAIDPAVEAGHRTSAVPTPNEARITVGEFDRASSTIDVLAENAPEDTLSLEIRASIHGLWKSLAAERLLEGTYRN